MFTLWLHDDMIKHKTLDSASPSPDAQPLTVISPLLPKQLSIKLCTELVWGKKEKSQLSAYRFPGVVHRAPAQLLIQVQGRGTEKRKTAEQPQTRLR